MTSPQPEQPGQWPQPGQFAQPGQPGYWAPPGAHRHCLSGLGIALMIMLGTEAAASLGSIALPGFGGFAGLLALALVVVFLVWFYRARINAGGSDWRQRRGPGWAIGAWFVPVIWLWFPFQVMADIWRANLPAQARMKPAVLPGIWWTCWLLLWFTGIRHFTSFYGSPRETASVYTLSPGSTWISKIFVSAAAVTLLLIVRAISSGELGSGHRIADP